MQLLTPNSVHTENSGGNRNAVSQAKGRRFESGLPLVWESSSIYKGFRVFSSLWKLWKSAANANQANAPSQSISRLFFGICFFV